MTRAPTPKLGWRCPDCGSVHAPTVMTCPCGPNSRLGRAILGVLREEMPHLFLEGNPTMQLTPHFSLEEFTISDTAHEHGISNQPATADHMSHLQLLALSMEKVRIFLGNRPLVISSAYRSPAVNSLVGGVANSDHCLGYACDFHTAGLTDMDVAERLQHQHAQIPFDQLIWEKNRCVHWSINPRMRGQVLSQPGGPGSPFHTGIS